MTNHHDIHDKGSGILFILHENDPHLLTFASKFCIFNPIIGESYLPHIPAVVYDYNISAPQLSYSEKLIRLLIYEEAPCIHSG
jgi:hypothetical protein